MIRRTLEPRLLKLAGQFPVVSVTGPRQSGKTTLVRDLFNEYEYLNCENLDVRMAAEEDPRRFLRLRRSRGAIIDEAQRVPALFSYLQGVVDDSGEMGQFILTGSQNFLLLEKITQSLAGRVAVNHLMPFDACEMRVGEIFANDIDDQLLNGCYPPLHDRGIAPEDFFPAYIETYVERDVRSIKNISNLALFQKFLVLTAGRVGQIVNLTNLGNEVGVDHKTIDSWLSILEASFILFKLPPYYRNLNKRIVKQPKIYFLDTGLLCSLLGIRSTEQLVCHPLRGGIFENYIISEHAKQCFHRGERPNMFFWRDRSGHEIDLIVERGLELRAYEVKAGETVRSDMFRNLEYFASLFELPADQCQVIYGGAQAQSFRNAQVIPWRMVSEGCC